MSEIQLRMTTDECTFDLVFGFMLPMFLASAGGDLVLARTAMIELLGAYQAATPAEIELVARIISFSHVAMDSLRQSMRPDLSDATVLRYRGNALAMNRAAEQCRKTVDAMQKARAEPDARALEATQVVPPGASRSMPPPPRPPVPQMPKPPLPRVPTPPPQPAPPMRHAGQGLRSDDLSATEADAIVDMALRTLAAMADPGAPTPVMAHPCGPGGGMAAPHAPGGGMADPHAPGGGRRPDARTTALTDPDGRAAAMRPHTATPSTDLRLPPVASNDTAAADQPGPRPLPHLCPSVPRHPAPSTSPPAAG